MRVKYVIVLADIFSTEDDVDELLASKGEVLSVCEPA